MEGRGVVFLVSTAQKNGYLLPSYFSSEQKFLSTLQEVHDSVWNWKSSETMRESLMEVALHWKLNSDFLPTLKFSDR